MLKRILIVEDSKSISHTLKNLIEEDLDVTIDIAASKKECANQLLKERGKYDIIITDLGLPDSQNDDIVDFVTKFSIPIIVLTGANDVEKEEIIRNKNIVDYIIKDGISSLTYASSIVKRVINNRYIKVLVVDDSQLFLTKTKELLEKYKLIVFSANDGRAAIDILEKHPDIKLVLTDYLMPNFDGLELTKYIRKRFKKDEMSIIVTSSDENTKVPSKFLKYGANDFIYKGFSSEEFFVRINSNLEILELFGELKDKANKDFLTGMHNRRYLFDAGLKIYEEKKSNNNTFCVAIMDIDKFKDINDTYGHDAGDEAIRQVAKILDSNLDKDSFIARLGGEEFCILLFNKDEDVIKDILEDLRLKFEINDIEYNDLKINYTVSIGCSFEFGNNFDEMIQYADQALYNAKETGRNRVRYRV